MRIKALAHRGDPLNYPENTMISYQSAYQQGYSHLEIDVHLSKDGVPVLMHDITVDRMTNSQGFIKDFTLNELKALLVGGEEEIPTLRETLEYFRGKIFLSIEIKQHGNLYVDIEKEVLQEIKEAKMLNEVYVNSFDHFSMIRMRELSKDVELGIIQHGSTPAVIPLMKDIQAKYLSLRVEYLTDKFVDMCEKNGIQIVVWPVDKQWHFDIVNRYPQVISTTNDLQKFKKMYMKNHQY